MIKVQVVDDNAAMRAVVCLEVELADGLELAGEAGDGAEAVVVARERRPDVILLDLDMPRMDGLEALPHLVAAVPEATVVVYTSKDCERSRDAARRLGAHGYVTKQRTPIRALLALVSGMDPATGFLT